MQEFIALTIVFLCFSWLGYKLFLGIFKDPLAKLFLRGGKVSLAMRIRRLGETKRKRCKCRSAEPTSRKIAAGGL